MNKAKSDSETLSSKYEDMERAERLVRVALEQVSKKVCHFLYRLCSGQGSLEIDDVLIIIIITIFIEFSDQQTTV